jgi:hypothetical protein
LKADGEDLFESRHGFWRRVVDRVVAVTSTAASSSTGAWSHTAYHFPIQGPTRVRVTRLHHPLGEKELVVLKGGQRQILVQLADGSTMRLPRSWTDAHEGEPKRLSPVTCFTIESLRQFMILLDALRSRR